MRVFHFPTSRFQGLQLTPGLFFYIGCDPADAGFLNVSGGKEGCQGALDGGEADIGAGLGDFLLGNLARGALNDGFDSLRF